MNKDEFLDQFSDLNASIESALAAQDFDRAMRIDFVRRQVLHDFASTSVPDGDEIIFETLERCAADNARAISRINSEMGSARHASSRNLRRLKGYRRN